jgi:hypothetical protein
MQFLSLPNTQQLFEAAATKYRAASAEWKHADSALKKFVAVCTKDGSAISLPGRLRWKLVEQSQLFAVADNDAFYAKEIADLKQIEKEASERAYDALKRAKEKHVAYLRQICNAQSFIASSMEEFRKYVTRFASELDTLYGSAPSAAAASAAAAAVSSSVTSHSRHFIDSAVAAFVQHMHQQVNRHVVEHSDQAVAEDDRKAADSAAKHNAQETVLAGATTGQTITALISRQLQPVVQTVQRLQQQRPKQAAQSGTVPAAAAHLGPIRPQISGKKHPRQDSSRGVADAFADTARPGTTVQCGGKKEHLSLAHRDNHSPHRSSNPAHSNKRPKNGEGGGRHPQQEVSFVPRGGSHRGRGRGGRGRK